MAFNFGSIASINATANVSKQLTPWDIHEVTFAGCRIDHIQGKKDPSMTYDIFKTRFENEDGYYEESVFFPKEGDDVRPTYQNKEGHDYQAPSNFEKAMTFISQLVKVIAGEEKFGKFQAMSSKFRSFEDVCNAVIKVTESAKGVKKTQLKLVGKTSDNRVVPCLPKIVGISKAGEAFTADNFIGDKLFFTPYEEGRRKDFLNSTPTDMAKVEAKNDASLDTPKEDNSDLDNIDFESLL